LGKVAASQFASSAWAGPPVKALMSA
jgi:hypothetical protein